MVQLNVSNVARLSEFLVMAKEHQRKSLYCLEQKWTKCHDNSVSMATFHKDKNKCSINKSKTMGSVTSKNVITLIWQVTAKIIIKPPVLAAILACFTKVNNAFYMALAF